MILQRMAALLENLTPSGTGQLDIHLIADRNLLWAVGRVVIYLTSDTVSHWGRCERVDCASYRDSQALCCGKLLEQGRAAQHSIGSTPYCL